MSFLALSATFMPSCAKQSADTSADKIQVEKNIAEKQADAALPATMDDRQAVVDLHNDNLFRPDMKLDRPTVIDFNATWCGPCKQFAPAFHLAAEQLGQTVDFISIDVDENPKTAVAFGISSIPTVLFIKPDGSVKKYVGTGELLPAERFIELVKAWQ